MSFFRRAAPVFWSVVIAVVLWVQVHGQGMGSLRMDVSLQVRGVPADMVIVNDLPDLVSITVSGLQAQLNALSAKDLFVSVNASALRLPGVVEQALDIEAIDLPVGLKVEKIQPDSVQLQVDHIVKRTIEITPVFDLPQSWEVNGVSITPSVVQLSGPEVWLSTLNKIETTALRLNLAEGAFDVETVLVPLSGKGIHLLNKDLKIHVRGDLRWVPAVAKILVAADAYSETSDLYANAPIEKSIVPIPVANQTVVEVAPIEVETTDDETNEVVQPISPTPTSPPREADVKFSPMSDSISAPTQEGAVLKSIEKKVDVAAGTTVEGLEQPSVKSATKTSNIVSKELLAEPIAPKSQVINGVAKDTNVDVGEK